VFKSPAISDTEERDKRTLFVKNLPDTVTEKQITSLSADIIGVRIRKSFRQNAKNNRYVRAIL